MKEIANIALAIISLVCIAAAVSLAMLDKPDWGWFLFAGLLCAGGIRFTK